jgi:hypothetical protein
MGEGALCFSPSVAGSNEAWSGPAVEIQSFSTGSLTLHRNHRLPATRERPADHSVRRRCRWHAAICTTASRVTLGLMNFVTHICRKNHFDQVLFATLAYVMGSSRQFVEFPSASRRKLLKAPGGLAAAGLKPAAVGFPACFRPGTIQYIQTRTASRAGRPGPRSRVSRI